MAKENLTASRVQAFACPEGKSQAFLWDAKTSGLALRVTAGGARAYIFQSRLKSGDTIRTTIGTPLGSDGRGVWSIPDAQAEARRLQTLIDQGRDPRVEQAAQTLAHKQQRSAERLERQRSHVSGLDAWAVYCKDRQPHWSERNYADHLAFSREGGADRARARGVKVQPGPLRSLLDRPLNAIDAATVQTWVARETAARPARAALGFRLLRAFINWCAEEVAYRALVNGDACKGRRTREKLGRPNARADALQREQLAAWFTEVRRDPNIVASVYLQCLLLTGARREELAGLKWEDVDFDPRVRTLRIRDKVEGERVIPLTPFVAQLLAGLPRRNEWVFSAMRLTSRKSADLAGKPQLLVNASASGRLHDARGNHTRALARAGLPHVSLHGLRRSFGTLAEWCEVPVGIVAQIQGHKPSAIAEKHYRVRPIDLLRQWHTRIEAWVLAQAGIEPAEQTPGKLYVVNAAGQEATGGA